jgi:hypothetical protein
MAHTRPILALAALLAFPAFADDAKTAPPPAAATPAPATLAPAAKTDAPKKADPNAGAGANFVVAKDSVTGKLRPATAAEREQLLGRRPLASPAPEIVTFPDGSVMMKERPEDANYAVATRNADGTLSTSCVHGAEAARAAVASAPAPSPSPAPKNADR